MRKIPWEYRYFEINNQQHGPVPNEYFPASSAWPRPTYRKGDMTKYLEQLVSKAVDPIHGRIRGAACDLEDINLIIKQTVSDIYSRYLRTRSRGKVELSSTLMDKYLAELREAETIVTEEIQRVYFNFRRRRDIAKIEFPALEQIISREMVSRSIPYLFKTQEDENILTVQIVSEYFFDIPITMENVDRVTRLMRYFLNRPDCAGDEMPEIRRRRDYRLAKSWKDVASSGSL